MYPGIPAAAVVFAGLFSVVSGGIQQQIVLRRQRHLVASDATTADVQVAASPFRTGRDQRSVTACRQVTAAHLVLCQFRPGSALARPDAKLHLHAIGQLTVRQSLRLIGTGFRVNPPGAGSLYRIQRFQSAVTGIIRTLERIINRQQRIGDWAGYRQRQPTLLLLVTLFTPQQIIARIDTDLTGHYVKVLIRNHVRAADMRLAAGHDIHVAAGRANGADALALGGAVFVQLMTGLLLGGGHTETLALPPVSRSK
ncbi:Uncharacterised protein [Serratia quinivorans]|nr:Uncharacterised protein [Serratia quinivorans]